MKPLDKNETGELIAAIHSIGKDKVRELALLMWQHIQELQAANYQEAHDGWVACSDRLPESKPGVWSKEIVAVTNLGDVFKLSCIGGYWQRTSEFIDSGATSITH
ncbi:hypothetical protein Eta_005 [Serratia phage Eta]|uniref:Uncharacterized protein n=1 Tax=Serratia phage Eta TaxID=1282995 RepID=R9VX39_9CAUD|nr:hypothetical protein Eta_005 [Serratia phage Eta]AGN89451.1 hypothetical protein Eta_005 [Serratia phage Eta]